MKRLVLIVSFLGACFLPAQAQKSKVIAVFQLIETGKYKEAKEAIEEAIGDEKTKEWARTWYARGLLCQTAYQKGTEENDKKKYELYPDQLYVAFKSYEMALSLDNRGKLDGQMAPLYVHLANDFQELGEKHYRSRKYQEALKAFEHAIRISWSPILSVQTDANLVYNAALSAYEGEEWEKAIEYLSSLDRDNCSSNVPHLLSAAYLETADTNAAQKVLYESIDRYEDNENLVLALADLLFQTNQIGKSIAILDSESSDSPSKYVFPYTEGLVYQKTNQYSKAIDAYKEALSLDPDESDAYKNIGTCYYNIGVEIDQNARTIADNSEYLEEKERSAEAFEFALTWFEKAYEKDPGDSYVVNKIYQLYKVLGLSAKMKSLEGVVN